jgi:hypothetical protein
MSGSLELYLLPLLTGIGVFALVGLLFSLAEGWYEESKRDNRR